MSGDFSALPASAKPSVSGEGVAQEASNRPAVMGAFAGPSEPLNAEALRQRRHLFVVFDLDGTLALTDHRAHFLTQTPRDWRGFYAACDQDPPCREIISVARAMMLVGHRVEIWSGRSGEVREKTREWLCANGLAAVNIRMRPEGDHQPDTTLKAAWMVEAGRPDLVFEDRSSMVAMWRSRGIVCAQVAPGDF